MKAVHEEELTNGYLAGWDRAEKSALVGAGEKARRASGEERKLASDLGRGVRARRTRRARTMGRMKLIRNRADVGGLIVLAVIVLAGAALALAGLEIGLFVLTMMAGIALGMALVHLATRPRRTRKAAALVLLLTVPVLFTVTVAGLILGIEGLILAPRSFQSPSGGFLSGLMVGGLQVAFGRLVGRGPWAGD